jgi:hypothetical protein
MRNQQQRLLFVAMRTLLRPLVRILLRNGIAYGAFGELARKVYVDVAFADFARAGKKQTVSRVSALTGLSRKEVKRLCEITDADEIASQERYSRAVRVISGWMNDRRFLDDKGRPMELPLEGKRGSFSLLVQDYSGDVPVKAMLSILDEAGSVSITKNGVRLARRAYVPGNDPVDKIRILGSDVYELASVIDHNLRSDPGDLLFQRKVSYDNIDPESMAKLRKQSSAKAQALLEQLDKQFAKHELPPADSSGRQISLGIYYFEDESSEE